MKTKVSGLVFLALLGLIMGSATVIAVGPPYTIDGNIADWGVTPFSDWVPDSPTCDYTVEDYPVNDVEPYGGELYDMEAMYFDDYYDGSIGGWAYFATVLSHPPEPNVYPTIAGDLALDLDRDPATGEYGYEYGVKIEGPDKGMICYMPDWHPVVDGLPQNSPGVFTCDGPSSVVKGGPGTAQVAYVNAGINDYPAGCNPVQTPCLENYIIEVGVEKAYLGLPEMEQISSLHATQTCGNDEIEIDFKWDFPSPEVFSVALCVALISPAFVYLAIKRRKK